MSVDTIPTADVSVPDNSEADPSFVLLEHIQNKLNGNSIYRQLESKELEEVLAKYKSEQGRENIWMQLKDVLNNPEEILDLRNRFPAELYPQFYADNGEFDSSSFLEKISTDLNALGNQIETEEGWLNTQVEGLRERAEVTKSMLEGVGNTPEVKEQQKSLLHNALGVAKKVLSYPIRHPVKTVLITAIVSLLAVSGAAYMAGGVEQLLQQVGISHIIGEAGAVEAAREMGNLITSPEVWDHSAIL